MMENVDRMLVDYYQSDGFRQDLSTWVAAPDKSENLRRHIVLQMNANRSALGRQLTDDMQATQGRFIAGDMSYDDLLQFMQAYVKTIRVKPR